MGGVIALSITQQVLWDAGCVPGTAPPKAHSGCQVFLEHILSHGNNPEATMYSPLGRHIQVPAMHSDAACHMTANRQRWICYPKLKQNQTFVFSLCLFGLLKITPS